MVLQLIDFTSEITDEELREFTSEYYIPFALHPVVPAAKLRVESTDVLAPTPLRSVPGATAEPPRLDATSVGSSEDADVAGAESEAGEVDSGLKRKRATSDDGAGTVEATSDSSAPVTHAAQSPPQTSPLTTDDISRGSRQGPKGLSMPWISFIEEFDMASLSQQAAAGGAAKIKFSSERSQSVQKDEEILLLKTQFRSQAVQIFSKVLCTGLAEKYGTACQGRARDANSADYKASCHWAVKYLEGVRTTILLGWMSFAREWRGCWRSRRRSYANSVLSMMRSVNPHSWPQLPSAGEAVEELHEKKLLTVPAAQVPGYNVNAYEELVAAMEAMKLLELPHIAQLERDQDYPIDVIMAGFPILHEPRHLQSPFALEKEVPLKESLEAHAIRLAKKKGVKGKAILCGVGAAHLPRSDGVPVSVATVSPKDSELLGKLEEAGDAAYQVGRSEQSRCHSI
ncbi:hypothetical protein Tco_0218682 [Tanacetum coccineum]